MAPPANLNINDLLDKEDVDLLYSLEEEIASGSFGTVYKGVHLPTGDPMAIKIITPDEDEVPEDLMVEIALLKQCIHKNIVKYYGGYRKADEIFIAMELCNCSVRDIFDYTEDPLLEKEIALIAKETLKGLEFMHANNYIHRDIKGGNILITDEGEVKLVDFGVSSLNAKKAKTFVGTPYWMAPELIDSKNGMTGYGPEIDIWALGITCIELAETLPPLSYINPMRALFQIPVRDSPTLEKKAKWSADFHDFLSKCLEKNPKKRPTATDLLQHPFVRDCDDSPQVLKDLIKRKQKLEQGGDDWDDDYDEDEDEFVEDEELASRIASSDSMISLSSKSSSSSNLPNSPLSSPSSSTPPLSLSSSKNGAPSKSSPLSSTPTNADSFASTPSPNLLLNVPIISTDKLRNSDENKKVEMTTSTTSSNNNDDLEMIADDDDLEAWLQGMATPTSAKPIPKSSSNNDIKSENNAPTTSNTPNTPTIPSPAPSLSSSNENLPPPTNHAPSNPISDCINNESRSRSSSLSVITKKSKEEKKKALLSSGGKWSIPVPTNPAPPPPTTPAPPPPIPAPLPPSESATQSTPILSVNPATPVSASSRKDRMNELKSPIPCSPSQKRRLLNEDVPEHAKQKSTLRRPPPTQRGKTRRSTQRDENVRSRINKRLIKEQMAALRELQAKGQRRSEKQEKDQQKERDQLLTNYKRQLDTILRNADNSKKSMERQHRADLDGLARSQKEQRRNLIRQHENDLRNLQKDIRELNKNAQKSHLSNQSKRLKEQKDREKQAKKIQTKSEIKIMKKEHKFEILLKENMFNLDQIRIKTNKEADLQWNQFTTLQKLSQSELQQTHLMEVDALKQLFGVEFDEHNQTYSVKDDELSKLQALELKLLQDKHQLQLRNLQELLDAERTQQSTLLVSDQRNQRKEFLINKRKLEKANLIELKQIAKQKTKSKSEVKLLQQESRSKFILDLQQKDKEFEDELAKQKKEEEEQIELHHKRQRDLLLEKQKDEIEELNSLHNKQRLELSQEELDSRMKLLSEHQQKMRDLIARHHAEQITSLETIHENCVAFVRTSQKDVTEINNNHHKEILGLLQIHGPQLLTTTAESFTTLIESHFGAALEELTSTQISVQKDLTLEVDKQKKDLAQTQLQEKADLEKLQEKQSNDIRNMPTKQNIQM